MEGEISSDPKIGLRHMGIVLQRLLEENIIDEKEKDKIESFSTLEDQEVAIFELVENVNWKSSIRILQLIKYVTASDQYENKPNPLDIPQILNVIFNFLDFNDRKTCAHVCQKWNKIADPMIKPKSKIVFYEPWYQMTDDSVIFPDHNLKDFLSAFESRLEQVTDYTFQGNSCCVHDFNKFFELQRSVIKRLELESLSLICESNPLKTYDISQMFISTNITELTISITTCLQSSTNIILSLDSVPNIEKLFLVNCSIKSPCQSKITPQEVKLKNIHVIEDDSQLSEFCINKLIDFSRVKIVDLDCSSGKCILGIDCGLPLNVDVNIDSISMTSARIKYLSQCNWSVNDFSIVNVDFIGRPNPNLKINHLSVGGSKSLNLLSLPPNLKSLILISPSVKVIKYEMINMAHLPELKKLHLHGNVSEYVRFDCEAGQLEEVFLGGEFDDKDDDQYTIHSQCIPESVQRLKLHEIFIMDSRDGRGRFHERISCLILDEYNFKDAADLDDLIRPTVLVLNWKRGNTFEVSDSVVHFVEGAHAPCIVVGKLYVKHFKSSELSDCVDFWSPYYIFKDQRGKAINKIQFESFMDVSNADVHKTLY